VVSVGCDAVVCRSELVSGAASLGCGVSCFVVGVGCGGGASLALGPGSNTALKLTWLSGGGKRRIARIGECLEAQALSRIRRAGEASPLAPRESKIMLADPLFSEGFQLVDRNAPCKEVVGRVNRISKSRASVTKFRQGQCPGFVLVDWAPWRSNAGLGRRLELGAKIACGGDLVFVRR
jgi:hypothetical protein